MIPMDNHSVPLSTSTTTGLVFPANYVIKPEVAALVMDWSPEEQYVLENGLAKLKDEPKFSKYVKIAAALPDRTVRDVALRCRWMTRKRSKREENCAGKNISSRKVVDTSPGLNMLANVPQQNALYVMNNMRHSTHMPFEGLVLSLQFFDLLLVYVVVKSSTYYQSGTFVELVVSGPSDAVMDRLQQNAQAFSQISYNLSAYKLQDNISLFYQARNNINAILTDMKEMPGIMSRMRPLPVSVNDDLASRLFASTTTQPRSYTIEPSIHLKQEPRI